ncbi:MAG: PhzF family phenazine biosynthesis protein [Candidatus Marinimicrobia bacterium]|nr:PhzF family phenazine biosynthesis protein [Candidatus Neomarinimicrobiota bacterium]
MPKIYQVDSFTAEPFGGNPAAVVPLNQPRSAEWMQLVAREMNLSETAFFRPDGDGYRLWWFTPTAEVDLCGHATLAVAHILWETGLERLDKPICFDSNSGQLVTRLEGSWINMDFPTIPATATDAPEALLKGLGVTPGYVAANDMKYLAVLEDEGAVRRLKPDMDQLTQLPVVGAIATAPADNPDYDFVSRVFAPAVGIPEDPVTGAAHCVLSHYWSERLGKEKMVAYQASTRGGEVRVEYQGDRTILGGQAVTVMKGELL